jgi:hypothetical protein
VWVLPLILLDEPEAYCYSEKIGAALQIAPKLFRDLDALITFRTQVAHHREMPDQPMIDRQLNPLDEKLMLVWSALAASYASPAK